MKNIKIIIVALFLLIGMAAQSKTQIQVHFPGSKGHKAFLWVYEDLVSYREILLGETISDSHENILFSLNNKNIITVKIQVEFFKIEFFVKPNASYVIEMDTVDMSNRDFYPKQIIGYLSPNFSITQPTKNEINAEMESVNRAFADFFDSNYVYLYQNRLPQQSLSKFMKDIDSLRMASSSDFVKRHIDIQKSQLNLMLRKTGTPLIVKEYFNGDKIAYNDKIYMDFFNSFWSKYLLVGIQGLRYGTLDSVINNARSYNALIRLIKNDPLLKDPKLRELVVLRNLIEMYSDWRFNKAAIQDILSDISAKGLTPENKMIAVNIRKSLMQYDNKKAPDFKLPDMEGNEWFTKESFNDKYVYLNIWNEKCPKCLANMDYEKELFLDMDDIIYFVSVYVGPDTATAKKVIKKRDYNWTQLYYNEDFEFLKNYKMELFPYYILLDKEGKIEWFPAKLPSENFSDFFIEMLNKKKGNLRE